MIEKMAVNIHSVTKHKFDGRINFFQNPSQEQSKERYLFSAAQI